VFNREEGSPQIVNLDDSRRKAPGAPWPDDLLRKRPSVNFTNPAMPAAKQRLRLDEHQDVEDRFLEWLVDVRVQRPDGDVAGAPDGAERG
jgi:hypothetical protein